MVHLKTQSTRKQPAERLYWKFRLVKRLYEAGHNREDLLELFRFIDWLLVLPEELAQSFQDQLKVYEVEMNTPYITSIERQGIAKGIEQGLSAERRLLYRQVARRFGESSAEQFSLLLDQLSDLDQLAEVGEWVIDCETGEALLARVKGLLG